MDDREGEKEFPVTSHIEIECNDPEKIINAMKPDMGPNSKFDLNVRSDDKKLIIEVNAKNVSSVLAGINSYLRLVKSIEKL